MKKIKGTYNITDCEHWGDVERAKSYINSLGCTIIDCYWDGRDQGIAWVEFWCYDNQFVDLYNKIGHSTYFSADINDYVSASEGLDLSYPLMKKSELSALKARMAEDYSDGFEERLPLWFLFELTDNCHYSVQEIISKVLSYFKENVEILGYSVNIVDGNKFCDVLIKSSYRNLTPEIMKYGIGDNCLSNRGWLKENHIYGMCSCVHELINTHSLREYDYIHRFVGCIKNSLPIEYRNSSDYFNYRDIVLSAEEYFSEDGTFRNVIEIDGKNYYVKDPASWDWRRSEYAEVRKKAKEDCAYDPYL